MLLYEGYGITDVVSALQKTQIYQPKLPTVQENFEVKPTLIRMNQLRTNITIIILYYQLLTSSVTEVELLAVPIPGTFLLDSTLSTSSAVVTIDYDGSGGNSVDTVDIYECSEDNCDNLVVSIEQNEADGVQNVFVANLDGFIQVKDPSAMCTT